ncbi:MAG: isoprenylcysteine carboxylmethyltransferase family protein, partial [Acidobacteriota bacterium]|nr:isoprenylcysteine carboxylmethyltransferase family protein [Acidobacteriota bacterium]
SRGAGVVAPPPLIYALPLLAGLFLQWWRPLHVVSAPFALVAGATCAVLGLVGIPAIVAFRRAGTSFLPWKTSTALVTNGPFRFTRNPMYLGMTLLYGGVSLWMNAAWPLFFLPIVLVVMNYGVIAREERYLTALFGEEYRAYCQQVRRWI